MFLLKAWVPYIHPVIVKDVIRITDEVVFFFINEGRNLPLCCSFFHGKPAFQGLRCGLAPRPNQCRCCRRGSGGACVSRDISCRIYGWEEPRAAGHRLWEHRSEGRGGWCLAPLHSRAGKSPGHRLLKACWLWRWIPAETGRREGQDVDSTFTEFRI